MLFSPGDPVHSRVLTSEMSERPSGMVTEPPADVVDRQLDWCLHLQPNGALLVERYSQYYLRLGAKGSEMLLLLSRNVGSDAVGRVARVLALADDREVEVVRRECADALAKQPVTKMWTDETSFTRLRVTGSRTAYLPLSAALQLSNACNLRCTFCYAESGPRMAGELDVEQWLEVFSRLSSAGVLGVTLTGGEPTLVKDFPRLLLAAASLFVTVDVFTNGTTWSPRLIELAGSLPNVRCQVSIDGLAETHDAVRRSAGSFSRSLKTVGLLADAGVLVMIAMTATPRNCADVGAVADTVAAVGARQFRVGKVQQVGRGAKDGFTLSTECEKQVERDLAAAASRNKEMIIVGWRDDDPYADVGRLPGLPLDFCSPAYLNWYVRADGRVTPCPIEDAALGHILEDEPSKIGSPDNIAGCARISKSCRCIGAVSIPGPGSPPPFSTRPTRGWSQR